MLYAMTAVENVLRYNSVKGPVKIQIFTDAYSLNTSYRVFVDYEEIFILGADNGVIELSSKKDAEGVNKSNRPYYTIPMNTGQVHVESIYFSKTLKRPQMTISSPIYCETTTKIIIIAK